MLRRDGSKSDLKPVTSQPPAFDEELLATMPTAKFAELGHGTYTMAYLCDDVPIVLKIPISDGDPKREARVYKEITGEFVEEITHHKLGEGWISTYYPTAVDEKDGPAIAKQLLEIYKKTRRIIVDGAAFDNWKKKSNGELICIDGGLGLRRGSIVSNNFWKNTDYITYWQNRRRRRDNPISLNILINLKYLESCLTASEIKNEYLQYEIIEVITYLLNYNIPITTTFLSNLATIHAINPALITEANLKYFTTDFFSVLAKIREINPALINDANLRFFIKGASFTEDFIPALEKVHAIDPALITDANLKFLLQHESLQHLIIYCDFDLDNFKSLFNHEQVSDSKADVFKKVKFLNYVVSKVEDGGYGELIELLDNNTKLSNSIFPHLSDALRSASKLGLLINADNLKTILNDQKLQKELEQIWGKIQNKTFENIEKYLEDFTDSMLKQISNIQLMPRTTREIKSEENPIILKAMNEDEKKSDVTTPVIPSKASELSPPAAKLDAKPPSKFKIWYNRLPRWGKALFCIGLPIGIAAAAFLIGTGIGAGVLGVSFTTALIIAGSTLGGVAGASASTGSAVAIGTAVAVDAGVLGSLAGSSTIIHWRLKLSTEQPRSNNLDNEEIAAAPKAPEFEQQLNVSDNPSQVPSRGMS